MTTMWLIFPSWSEPRPAPAPVTSTEATSVTAASTSTVLHRNACISFLPSSPCGQTGRVSHRRALRARANRVVHAPLGAERLADLADRAVRAQRLAHRRQQVRVA